MFPIIISVIKVKLRLRDLREDKDLSQEEIAAYARCSQQSYSRYENGVTQVPADVLARLAEYWKTSTDFLLGLTDEETPYPRAKHK